MATTTAVGAAMELAPALAMMNRPTLANAEPQGSFDLLWDEFINGLGGI